MNKESIKQFIRSNASLFYLIIALLALRWTFVEPYQVPTGSMEPTLKTGDRLWALKCAYDVRFPFTNWVLFKTGDVKRGDIILFQAPKNPKVTYVKRAVAVAGDRIGFRDGVLILNGEPQEKTVLAKRDVMYDIEEEWEKTLYIENLGGVRHYTILDNRIHMIDSRSRDMEEITIPEGSVFAVGDNRDNSLDSRVWGLAPLANMKGRGMSIWFSWWDWRLRPERIGTMLQ